VNENAHQPYEDDLSAYLLGALPVDEAQALERHMDGCERCRERERWLRSAVDLLPSSVEQVQPPPELRERLMATVRAEAEAERAAAEGAATDAGARTSSRREHKPSVWQRLFGQRPLAVGLATAFIVVAGVAGFLIGSNDGGGGRSTTTVIQAATGNASLERKGDSGTLIVDRLAPRPRKVYQAWIARAGKNPEPAGVFDVRADGRGSAHIREGLNDADEVLVTPEPPGGSPQPTANPVVRIRV